MACENEFPPSWGPILAMLAVRNGFWGGGDGCEGGRVVCQALITVPGIETCSRRGCFVGGVTAPDGYPTLQRKPWEGLAGIAF